MSLEKLWLVFFPLDCLDLCMSTKKLISDKHLLSTYCTLWKRWLGSAIPEEVCLDNVISSFGSCYQLTDLGALFEVSCLGRSSGRRAHSISVPTTIPGQKVAWQHGVLCKMPRRKPASGLSFRRAGESCALVCPNLLTASEIESIKCWRVLLLERFYRKPQRGPLGECANKVRLNSNSVSATGFTSPSPTSFPPSLPPSNIHPITFTSNLSNQYLQTDVMSLLNGLSLSRRHLSIYFPSDFMG